MPIYSERAHNYGKECTQTAYNYGPKYRIYVLIRSVLMEYQMLCVIKREGTIDIFLGTDHCKPDSCSNQVILSSKIPPDMVVSLVLDTDEFIPNMWNIYNNMKSTNLEVVDNK